MLRGLSGDGGGALCRVRKECVRVVCQFLAPLSVHAQILWAVKRPTPVLHDRRRRVAIFRRDASHRGRLRAHPKAPAALPALRAHLPHLGGILDLHDARPAPDGPRVVHGQPRLPGSGHRQHLWRGDGQRLLQAVRGPRQLPGVHLCQERARVLAQGRGLDGQVQPKHDQWRDQRDAGVDPPLVHQLQLHGQRQPGLGQGLGCA